MRLSHPTVPYQGLAPEDVFFAANDRFVQMGVGFVILSMQQEMYPEKPMQIYIYIQAQPSARNLLLGALLARAEQIRAMYPGLKGRIYTQLVPSEWDMLNFYSHNGFSSTDAQEEYAFPLMAGQPPIPPMSCQLGTVPLQSPDQMQGFLSRMNQYRLTPLSMDYLAVQMQQPFFLAQGFYRGGQAVAEIVMTGASKEMCGLVSLYVRQEYRRQGIAKALIAAASGYLAREGVTQCVTHAYSNNAAQMGLMRSLGASRRKIVSILPSIEIG